LNSLDATGSIKFTYEVEQDGKLPFLDILLKRTDSGGLKLCIYRKPTHTDQYLNFSSHHPVEHKLSMVRTLLERSQQRSQSVRTKYKKMLTQKRLCGLVAISHGLSVKLDVRWSLKVTRGRKRIRNRKLR